MLRYNITYKACPGLSNVFKCLSRFQGSLAISLMTEFLVPVCLNMLKGSLFPATKEAERISLHALSRENKGFIITVRKD